MSRTVQTLAAIVLLTGGFFAGRAYEAWQYEDICLDMGGGMRPGSHPICVVEHKGGG
ncbi:hypothetical protein [Ruegeria sp. HKCCD8929]|uniref:hypothetical protein n=1 Tax=Ruegeria sp. HKCCD8929 TaxID=2683006 RepID=UPI0014881977|nr:hypothetical protein [Ruegeria sp. HKCCD8929]